MSIAILLLEASESFSREHGVLVYILPSLGEGTQWVSFALIWK